MENPNKSNSLFGDIGNDEEFRKRYGEQIGCGMSAVIYARDGIVAKVFREGQLQRQVFQEAFTLAATADLDIPVPKVYGVGTFHGGTAPLMARVQGSSLLDVMRTRGALSTCRAQKKQIPISYQFNKVPGRK